MNNKKIKNFLEQTLKNILKVDLSVMNYDNRFGTLNIQVCFHKDITFIYYSKLAKKFYVIKKRLSERLF